MRERLDELDPRAAASRERNHRDIGPGVMRRQVRRIEGPIVTSRPITTAVHEPLDWLAPPPWK